MFSVDDNGDGIVIKGYEGDNSDLYIPCEIHGMPVTAIAYEAFMGQSFITVTLPPTMQHIASRAFADCTIGRAYYNGAADAWMYGVMLEPENAALEHALVLQHEDYIIKPYDPNGYGLTIVGYVGSYTDDIRIPSEIYGLSVAGIGTDAFRGLNIGTITFPETITYIADGAFADCTIERACLCNYSTADWYRIQIGWNNDALTNAMIHGFDWYTYQIDNGNATIVGTIPGYEPPTVFDIPDYLGGYPVTTIASYAFEGHWVDTVTLPTTITHIESNAFANCGLYRAYYAGRPEEWANVSVDPDNTDLLGAMTFREEGFWYQINADSTVTIRACDEYYEILHLRIPAKLGGYPVSAIEYQALNVYTYLESLYLPKSVTSIGYDALPTSLRTIYYGGSEADRNQMYIEDYAAQSCTWIYDVVSHGDDNGFSYCVKTDNTVAILKYLREELSVTVPAEIEGYPVTAIADYAFEGCWSIESITIPEGVTTIGDYAFYLCSALRDVSLPSTLTAIGNYAFCNCGALESVTIPEGVKTIGNYAFWWCSAMTSVTISEGVTTIGTHVFAECDNLYYIRLPKSLKTIDYIAFYGAPAYYIYYAGSKTDRQAMTIEDGSILDYNTFWYYNVASIGLTLEDVHQSDEDIYAYFITHDGTATITECITVDTHIEIPSTLGGYPVTAIENASFWGAANAQSIVIPDSVISIAPRAFENTAYYKDDANWDNYGLYIGDVLIQVKDVKSDRFTVRGGTRLIADEAFGGGIMTIAMPKSVTVIGNNAFNIGASSALCGIYYGGSEADWNAMAFGENADISDSVMIHYTNTVLGDTDGDGVITTSDCRVALTCALNSHPTEEELAQLDVNGDGKVSTKDVRIMMIQALST